MRTVSFKYFNDEGIEVGITSELTDDTIEDFIKLIEFMDGNENPETIIDGVDQLL